MYDIILFCHIKMSLLWYHERDHIILLRAARSANILVY